MRAISAVVGLVVLVATTVTGQDGKPASPSLSKASFSKLPIYFIENRGVYLDEVKYYIQGADKTLLFTKEGITFRLKGENRGRVVKLEFVGANPDVVPGGEDRQRTIFSYFRGPEKEWKTGLPTFAKVVYEELWPGIDLTYEDVINGVKYTFAVKPGIDPSAIRLRYRGADRVTLLESRQVCVKAGSRSFEDARPVAFQCIDGERVMVPVDYDPTHADVAGGEFDFGFEVAPYDPTRPLYIDPAILVYCGYLGGGDHDYAQAVAVDASGRAYVAGETNGKDAFVARVNAAGTALDYFTVIGGANPTWAYGVDADSAGNAYVAGYTASTEKTFPVKVGPDLMYGGGVDDGFVAKVNPQGTAIVYCGYIGGLGGDQAKAVAVDTRGRAHVTGYTWSDQNTLPVKVGPVLTHRGNSDGFVARVNPAGTGFDYLGYVGGNGSESGTGIAVDGRGRAYVTGWTPGGFWFPVTVGPDLTFNGNIDAFVARVNAAGTGFDYCGYIGGDKPDHGNGIAIDTAGNAYVTGIVNSDQSTFPVKVGPDLTFNGGRDDAFVAKINPAGTALDYCGYLGGNSYDWGHGIAADTAGCAYVTGFTNSTDFPVKEGPSLTLNNSTDAFITKVNPSGAHLVYSGFIGGKAQGPGNMGLDMGFGVAVDHAGNAYVVGVTQCAETTFPVKVGPDLTYNGLMDGFVAKVAQTLIQGAGEPRPSGTMVLEINASDDVGLLYQAASSFGDGPIQIDTRMIGLSADPVLYLSTWNVFPSMFVNYVGRISPRGHSLAFFNIPDLTAMIGIRIHTAFVTLDPLSPSNVKSISNTFSFSITK